MRHIVWLVGLLAIFSIGVAFAAPLKLVVQKAFVTTDQTTGRPLLQIDLAPDSREAFAQLTSASIGKVVHLRIDGKVVMSPRVVEPILQGTVIVSGEFSPSELRAVATRLEAGEATIEVEAGDE